MQYQGQTSIDHSSAERTGILLVNLGSPQAPETVAVRNYLREFLSDPRVVEIPRVLWWLILHGIILRTRPRRSAAKYATIWRSGGSPLLQYTEAQAKALRKIMTSSDNEGRPPYVVAHAMRYGEPAIEGVIEKLLEERVSRLLVLPLYPQYSATTTASVFDAVSQALQRQRRIPALRFIAQYHDHDEYIDACVTHLKQSIDKLGPPDRLLFSYHGIPLRNLHSGDPYHCHCHKTTRMIGERLGPDFPTPITTFQSRFGRARWLQPYTDETLKKLARDGVQKVQVFCPGFASDCLETIEEIDDENREIFLKAGGQRFDYIPALNAEPLHIRALHSIVLDNLAGWPPASPINESAFETIHQDSPNRMDR